MRILHLVSCRGWSSDAYWAARAGRELERRGHEVVLGCRADAERVIARARAEGLERIVTFAFAGGLRPGADVADLRRLARILPTVDVVHVHRGKEHWLAAVVNRAVAQRRPLIRTRHIAQAVRPHAANRWLYRHATDRVVTVSEAIRGQYLAAGLLDAARVSAMPGGADTERYRPQPADPDLRERLGGIPGVPLVGLVAGLRVMKGHGVALEAAARLHAAGMRIRLVFVGAGRHEGAVREAVARSGLAEQVSLVGFADDLPAVFAALDAVLYVPVESDGMSRVVFECLAAGRPLVASRVGVVAEVLEDDRHALLVPAGDAGALAATLGRLLGDPARAARLGVAGRGLVEARYSGARLAAALEELYARLAGRAAA